MLKSLCVPGFSKWRVWALGAFGLALLAGCAEDPGLSYPQAQTTAQCQQAYEVELQQWELREAQSTTSADAALQNFFQAFSNGIGLYQGKELFEKRRQVCLRRVLSAPPTFVLQPGSGGTARPYACRPNGGVFQGGASLCPGH